MNIELLGISFLTAIGFGVYGSRKWLRSGSITPSTADPSLSVEQAALLSDLSYLWTDEVVKIKDASSLWRERVNQVESGEPRTPFKHEEIEEFFKELVENRSSVQGVRRLLIIKILTLLDEEGDCPSVVRKNKDEAERHFSDDSYALLETVPLYLHTLRVTRNFISKTTQEALMADIIIIALAHDIGKIPSYHDSMYSMGDHPITAGLILNGIPEFTTLPNKDDILRAIGGHHLLKCDNILTDGLKMSDHEARQSELAVLCVANREKMKNEPACETVRPAVPLEKASQAHPPEEQREHPLGSYESPERFFPTRLDTPEWFNADAILGALKSRINVVVATPKGDQWLAVSTSQGLVFVKPEGLWTAIKDVCGNDPKILATDACETEKRNLLYTVVCEFSKKRGVIAKQYVSDRYYTTQVSVIGGGGNSFTYFLIPFKAQAFGEKASSLEELKSSQLKRMVRDVIIKQTEVEKCV